MQVPVERCGNHNVLVHFAQIGVHERFHPVGDVILGAGHPLGGDVGIHVLGCRLGLLGGDVALAHHVGQSQPLTLGGTLGMGARIVIARCGQDARQHGGLAQREIARRNAEIGLGRGLDAGRARPEMHAVEIELQNFVFGVVLLQPHRQQRFLHLAAERLVGGQKQVLGHLLGDGGRPARNAARADHFQPHRGQADRIDTEMAVKAPVFARHDSLAHIGRQFVNADGFAAGLPAIGQKLPVRGQNPDIGWALRNFPGRGRSQILSVIDNDTGHRDTAQKQHRKAEIGYPDDEAHPAGALFLHLAVLRPARLAALWRIGG